MKVRLKPHVYIRHAEDESVVVCPRTDGCTVMRDASPFLEQFSSDWREMDDIVAAIAMQFGCDTSDVIEDAYRILGALEEQDFAERDTWIERTNPNVSTQGESGPSEEDDTTPFGDFCRCHNLMAELHMDLTDGCNESCVHCYIPKGGATYLPKSIAVQILHEFREMEGLTAIP